MGTINQQRAGDRDLTQSGSSAEVPAVGRKRRHTEAYKLRILEEADACKRGELGALLRREGLYHSTIIKWRTWRDTMADKGFTPEQDKKAMRNELAKLQRENKRLKLKVERQDAMLDLQKKAFQILDLMPPENESGGKS